MANLTDSQRRAFARQLAEILLANSALLKAEGFDPAARIAELQTLAQTADQKEAAQLAAREASLRATTESTTATKEAYDCASATVDLITGFVGKDSELARLLRGLRGAESKNASIGTKTNNDQPIT